jgi:hypothetical protein
MEETTNNGEQPTMPPVAKAKRHRRTKAQMAEARAAEAAAKVANPTESDRVTGEVSADFNADSERAQNVKEIKVVLENTAAEQVYLAASKPLIDKINQSFDEVLEAGKKVVRISRDTGNLLHEWRKAAGYGNWISWFNRAGFHMSLATAENWMRLSLLTDEEIESLPSVRQALELLKDQKKKQARSEAHDNEDDNHNDDDNGSGSLADVITKVMTPPPADESKPEPESKPKPEFELTLLDELEMVMKRVCTTYPKQETAKILASMLSEYYALPVKEETVV